MKLLGIDYGTKRIGLAVSDDEGKVAFPYKVIENNAKVLQTLSLLISERKIEKIIIGESKNYAMNDNEIMEEVRDFAQALQTHTLAEVEFHLEMMTSMQATKMDDHMFGNTKTKRSSSHKKVDKKTDMLDAKAAAVILQSYIDSNQK